jgi:hypothetical protein
MDPFDSEILHEDVHTYIAQHFTGKDLLTMSEVSKSWNEFTEDKKIGDKVRLKINSDSISKQFAGTSRSYKDLLVDVGSNSICFAPFIPTYNAEKLEINFTDSYGKKGRDFPRLKSLDLTVDDDNHWILKSKMKRLEELKLTLIYDLSDNDYNSYREDIYRCAHDFLSRLKNLKRLDISDCDSDQHFLEYSDQYLPFKLEHFKGDLNYYMYIVNEQRESLQSLSSKQIVYQPHMRDLFLQFPKLTTLEFTRRILVRCYQSSHQHDNQKPQTSVQGRSVS